MAVRPLAQITPPPPISTACFDFVPEDTKQFEKRTVVIACISVKQDSEGVTRLRYACNRGLFCADGKCRYSIKASYRKQENESDSVEPLG